MSDRQAVLSADTCSRSIVQSIQYFRRGSTCAIARRMIRDTAETDVALAQPPQHYLKRWAMLPVVCIALASLLYWGISKRNASQRSVSGARISFAKVTRGTLVRDALVRGRVVAAVSPTLYARQGGIVSLQVHAGDSVKRGDLVAQIDAPDLKAEFLRERLSLERLGSDLARQRILAAKQRLLVARAKDEADVSATAAQREAGNVSKACESQALSRFECQRVADVAKSADIRRTHATADARLELQNVGFELQSRQKELERQHEVVAELERRLAALSIRSPIDGVVGSVAVLEQAVVVTGAVLMTVVDLSKLEVELEIPETYADDLGLGMRATVNFGAGAVSGALASIAPEVLNHQVLARVRFDSQPTGLRQNQRIDARVLIDEKADVVKVPRGPFLEAHGGRAVYVMKGDIATKRSIRVGVDSIDSIEVLEGLTEGEEVVVSGSDTFENVSSVAINR